MIKRLMNENILNKWRTTVSEENLPLFGIILAAVLALLPVFGLNNYFLHIAVLVFVYASLSLGLNIVVGFAGLLDLGYVAFYAVGAYSYALLGTHYRISFLPALIIGSCLAAIFGVILGWPTIRTRGDYLALVTLGFGEIIRLILRNWTGVTNGPNGIMYIPQPVIAGMTFSTPTHFYYLGLAFAILTLTISWRIKYSAVGYQLAAVRDDEDAAAAIGINPVRWKLYAFAVGAFIAGMAGVFFASWQTFVSPESFTLGESILVLSIVVLGGMGRLWTTICAAAFLILLPEALRGLENYRIFVLGVFLVAVVVIQERIRLLKIHRRSGMKSLNFRLPGAAASVLSFESETESNLDKTTILHLSNISKSFGGICALENFSIDIARGEVIGLVGLNGAGKTTLFNCIAGALRPDSGEIKLVNETGGVVLNDLPPYIIARKGLVRTFQQPRPFSSLSAGENVGLGKRCNDIPKFWEPLWSKGKAKLASDASCNLQAVGAPAPITEVIGMSFVDQKLIELARALATQPKVLLLDEPASGMEPAARQILAQVIKRINSKQNVTVIVVEHDLAFLNSICRRLVMLDRGRLVADGAPDDEHVISVIRRTYHPAGRRNKVV